MPVESPVLLVVRRIEVLHHHGSLHCHGTTRFHADGSRSYTFARNFACAGCGEPLHDGDRGFDTPNGFVHSNCYTGK